MKKPNLRDVKPADLRSTGRLLTLFDQARDAGLIASSDYDRLRFVTAAEHALVKGTRNACGLFVHIVRKKLWHFCTNDDEDAANQRLKRHFYGDTTKREPEPDFERPKLPPIVLSEDARLVVAVRRVAEQHRLTGDPFYVLRRERPDWTRERWDKAVGELDNARYLRLQQNYAGRMQ